MTGFQLTARVRRSAELVPQPCGPPSFSNSSRLRNWRWRTSAPDEKARPLPLRITTSASGSRSNRRNASASCATTSSLTAFNLSGRLIVIVAILSAQEYSTRLWMSAATAASRKLPPRQLAGQGGGCQRRHAKTGVAVSDDVEQVEQNNNRDRDPDRPEQNGSHGGLRSCAVRALFLADDFARRILGLADRAADVPLGVLGPAFRLHVAIAGELAGLFLDRAGRLLDAADDALLVHRNPPVNNGSVAVNKHAAARVPPFKNSR